MCIFPLYVLSHVIFAHRSYAWIVQLIKVRFDQALATQALSQTRSSPSRTTNMAFRRWMLLIAIVITADFPDTCCALGKIRLCGRKLADLLNDVCLKNGGFHAPKIRRGGNVIDSHRNLIELLKPMDRRNAIISSDDLAPEATAAHGGVVDECCRKTCSLTTLVSYCAKPDEQLNLDAVLQSSNYEDNNIPIEVIAANEHKAQHNLPSSSEPLLPHIPQIINLGQASRPNLGLFSRDRPVFVVLSKLQEDGDHLVGEYRF